MSGSRNNMPSGNNSVEDLNCNNLFIETNLSSPNSEVLEDLAVDDILFLSLNEKNVILAVTDKNKIAGSITSSVTKLIKCLNDGYHFVGIIFELDGTKCKIKIRPRSI